MSAYHRAIAEMSNTKSQALGALGEFLAKCKFQMSGYHVEIGVKGDKEGDLKVFDAASGQCFRVEVKTARRNKRKEWCFTLSKRGHTSHDNTDFVVLFAVRGSGRVVAFVIPTEELRQYRAVTVTSDPDTYRGKWSRFRQGDTLRLAQGISQ